MKKLNNIIRHNLVFLLFVVAAGCSESFLDRPPEDALTIDNFYQTDEQVNASTAALYGFPWFEFNDKAIWSIGEIMAGNFYSNDGDMGQFCVFGVNQSNSVLLAAWNSLFRVITHSNTAINNVPQQAGPDVSADLIKRVVGEGKYMRAVAYFYLVRLWGAVPIIEDNTKYIYDARIPKNRIQDVYQLIINDLNYAAANCSELYADKGRITSWAAKSMLAKVYLTRSGFGQSGSRLQSDLDSAKYYAENVLTNSGLELMPDYADLFMIANENSDESLFAFQWLACGLEGTQNTIQSYWAYNGELTGAGDGWGSYNGPSIDLQNEYEPGDLRRHETIMQNGDFYPELRTAFGGFTFVQEPGDDIGEMACHAASKKYVIGRSEDHGTDVCFRSIGMNTYIQRLADVYLIYAEAILGNNASTVNEDALWALNTIRDRADLPPRSSITLDSIYHERRIEFALESEYWYDLARLHYWSPVKAREMINAQERGTYHWVSNTPGSERVITSYHVAVSDNNFVLPIPGVEIDNNPLLNEDPVPYKFSE